MHLLWQGGEGTPQYFTQVHNISSLSSAATAEGVQHHRLLNEQCVCMTERWEKETLQNSPKSAVWPK